MATYCPKCKAENPDTQSFCGDCGTKLFASEAQEAAYTKTLLTPVEDLTKGTLFANRYEIIEELGKGGMGKVYKAIDNEIHEEVAIKLLKPDVASDEKIIERFRNELKIARKIAHKNVCRTFHIGKEDNNPYITMEFVPGRDLKSLIKTKGTLPKEEALSLAKQVCAGLTEAHELGVVHRDLKPQNIMIDESGVAKIMDFGIARSVEAEGVTEAGMIIGTPDYISPEQAEGEEADQRSDIYSLGVILYEMVTGTVPFRGDTVLSVALKHKSQLPPDPRKLNAELGDDLARLILICMEKARERRYQTAAALLDDLQNIEEGFPLGTKIRSRRETLIAAIIRRKLFIPASIVVLAVIAVAILAFFFLRGGRDIAPPENMLLVVLPFENLGPPEDEYFADGITDEVTNRLSLLYGLDVISRTSANQYKGIDKTIKQIREELNMDYVVTGTVRWDKSAGEGGRVRVSPQLIRASDDTQLWSENYEHSLKDIFAVQIEIAEEVIKQLDITLLESERRALREKPTENLEAYDHYLRAEEQFEKAYKGGDEKNLYLAIEMFERAIELDPGFVRAYIRLSFMHSRLYFQWDDHTEERLAKSKAAVDKSLELRPEFPEAKLALAFYYYRGFRDYDRALEIFESIQKARPNFSSATLGYIRRRQGKWEEALEALEKAFRLNPRSLALPRELGITNMHMRKYEEADVWYDRSLSLRPEDLNTRAFKIINSLHLTGEAISARTMLETYFPSQRIMLWMRLLQIERNFNDILERLDSFRDNQLSIDEKIDLELSYALIYHAQEEIALMKSHADAARIDLENAICEQPENPGYHSDLGKAYAYLGRKDEAIRDGYQAVKLLPVSKDALAGPDYVWRLIQILIITGEYDDALDKIEYLMSIPAGRFVSISLLRYGLVFDPLREHPRFKRLLEMYSEDHS